MQRLVTVSLRIIRQHLGKSGGKFVKEILNPLLSEKYRVKWFAISKKNIKNLIGKKLFLLIKVPFNYIS